VAHSTSNILTLCWIPTDTQIRLTVRSGTGERKITVPDCQIPGNDDGNCRSLHAVRVMKGELDVLSILSHHNRLLLNS
jgi:hypothetical protein